MQQLSPAQIYQDISQFLSLNIKKYKYWKNYSKLADAEGYISFGQFT